MQIKITGRKMEVTEALKNHVEDKISKIEKYLENVTEIHVVLSVEKYRHFAEITFNLNGTRLHAESETEDMYSSIEAVVLKLKQQINKYKTKIKTGNHVTIEPIEE